MPYKNYTFRLCYQLVTSAIQSDILHLYLRAVDVYINVSHLPYMQSIPVLANCHG